MNITPSAARLEQMHKALAESIVGLKEIIHQQESWINRNLSVVEIVYRDDAERVLEPAKAILFENQTRLNEIIAYLTSIGYPL